MRAAILALMLLGACDAPPAVPQAPDLAPVDRTIEIGPAIGMQPLDVAAAGSRCTTFTPEFHAVLCTDGQPGCAGCQGTSGTLHQVVRAVCPAPAWRTLRVEAEVPAATALDVRGRTAQTREDLAGADYTEAVAVTAAPIPLHLPAAEWLQLQLFLHADVRGPTPTVRGLSVVYRCP